MTTSNGGPLDEINKFGLRLRGWLEELVSLPIIKRVVGVVPGGSLALTVIERHIAFGKWIEKNPGPINVWFPAWIKLLTSGEMPDDLRHMPTFQDFLQNPDQFFQDALAAGVTGTETQAAYEAIGSLIYDTSVAAITGRTPPQGSEAADRARAFVGYVTALGAAPQIMSVILEAGSMGQMDMLGQNIQQVYWNLGLGFLTWQVMAPILQAAILEPLTEDVQLQWRGKRFTRGELQELFALGKISRDEFSQEQRKLGWRDNDIDRVIELSYNTLSRGDAIELWHKGIWTPEQCAEHLRGLGYRPLDVELIMRLEDKQDVVNDRTESISILGNSFEEGLLPEADFRAALDAQGYTIREVDLRVQLIRFKQQNKARKLSVAQLKDAWTENVVGDQQVIKELVLMGYADSEVDLLLDTWKAELQPDFLRVNQSTILEMYRFGIFTRDEAIKRLESIGYNRDDAVAQVDLTEVKFPEAFGAAAPRKQRLLSLGAVVDLFIMGRLTDDDLRKWTIESGFSPVDQDNMITLILEQAKGGAKPLTQSTILDAYATGVFNRETALINLMQIGYERQDAETTLATFEAKNPAVFNPSEVSSVRQPTIGALVQAVQSGFITEQEFFQKAALIGFSREGALLYLENARAKTIKGTKKLTKADVLEFYRKNLMSYPEAFSELTGMGYSERDSDLLLRSEAKGVTATDVWSSMLAGFLDPNDAIIALLGLGFTQDEIQAAFNAAEQE